MGKRELIALLNLSSWCLVMVERLFLVVPRGCLAKYMIPIALLNKILGLQLIAIVEVSNDAKIRNRYNRYNQVPHMTQDTNGKVTNSQ